MTITNRSSFVVSVSHVMSTSFSFLALWLYVRYGNRLHFLIILLCIECTLIELYHKLILLDTQQKQPKEYADLLHSTNLCTSSSSTSIPVQYATTSTPTGQLNSCDISSCVFAKHHALEKYFFASLGHMSILSIHIRYF